MRRRTLLGGIGGAIMLAPLAGCRPWLKQDPRPEAVSDHHRATITAMAATFIPSGDGSPGATEADATALILDPAYPVVGYLRELIGDVDDWCFVRHGGRAFIDLAPAERERALEERMGLRGRLIQSWYKEVYEGVLVLSKLAFFGGLRRSVGTTYTQFPGPSIGYVAASAGGVHVASGAEVTVEGAGNVRVARVTALVAGVDPARASLRLTDPMGATHDVRPDASLTAPLVADRQIVPGANATFAAGTWRLAASDGITITAWWLDLRTDLDDRDPDGVMIGST